MIRGRNRKWNKQILSMFLVSMMTLGMVSGTTPAVYAADDLSDPITNVTLQDIDGDGAYEISDKEDLYAFANLVNAGKNTIHGELIADITVNTQVLSETGLPASDTYVQWIPIGNHANPYAGTFDGANHAISGLYLEGFEESAGEEAAEYVGFFGVADAAAVKDLTIRDSYFAAYAYVGGIAGSFGGAGGVMENCITYATVKGYQYAGGASGEVQQSNLLNCHNHGLVIGYNMTGGFTVKQGQRLYFRTAAIQEPFVL